MTSVADRLRGRLGAVRVFDSAASRRRVALHLLAVVLLVLAATALVHRHLAFLADADALRAFVRGFGVWAPIALVALQALQVVLAPVPGQILAVVSGYLFGAWWGTLYNMIGVTIGSAAAFWLARRFGRAYVERAVHEDALARFDAVDDTHARVTLFLFFLVPGLPDDVLCFVGGLTRVPLSQLVVIAVVGRAPGFLLVNVVGDLVGADRLDLALLLAVVLLAVSVMAFIERDRLLALVGGEV